MTQSLAPNLAGVRQSDSQQARCDGLRRSDPQFCNAQPLQQVTQTVSQLRLSLSQVIAAVFEGYADRPALGSRSTELKTDPVTGRTTRQLLPRFDTVTYGQAWQSVQALNAAWHHDAALRIAPGDLVCMIGFAGADYVVVDFAAVCAGAVVVPLAHNAPVATLQAIVAETQPRCLATSLQCLSTAVEVVLGGYRPASLLVFDYADDDDDQRDRFEAALARLDDAGVVMPVVRLSEQCERGAALPPVPLHVPAPGENPLRCLIYTSGSTGSPKGAMWREHVVRMPWFSRASVPALSLVYMPMNHGMGRVNVAMTLTNGGTCYFVAKDDLSTLLEDIRLVRPTSLALVPRIVETIHQQFQRELQRAGGSSSEPGAARRAALDVMRDVELGGRILSVTGGSAPLSRELRHFVEHDLDFSMIEGYGSTETSAVSLNNRVLRPPVIDYKLVDVPELGYFTTDRPHPRGELLVKTQSMMEGYYKRPDVTAAVFDADGFYKTGDIMVETGPDQLVYLDRRNNVLKLAQGEFVTVARLEALFASHDPLIRQVMVYGNSSRSFLLAVVVPNVDLVPAGATDEAIRRKVCEVFKTIAAREHLHAYEVPRDCLIEREPFSVENGLLSGIGKPLRPALKERYGARLEQLYEDLARNQADELRRLREHGRSEPVIVTLARAAQAVLGIDHVDLQQRTSFRDLGGDSLSALSFSLLLEEIFDVDVPVGLIAGANGDLQALAKYIEREHASADAPQRPTVASVHGRGATHVHACDLTLDRFIDAATLQRAATLPPTKDSARGIRTVLVTGATGFLGRFLCLEWLERMAEVGGRVICIARGRDADDARQRVMAAFDSGDANLMRHVEALAAAHLDVLTGDLTEAQLGLAAADWQRLAAQVDLIVHPAALVNHVLPYSQLFGPNVVGTAELIRLALTERIKRFNNVSSVAVMLKAPAPVDEDVDIRVASPMHAVDVADYASGYAASKWAGEVLLREAHQHFGVPVANFRCDMILPHSRYAGQVNKSDILTRWLFSLLVTEVAPPSNYQRNSHDQGEGSSAGSADKPHYDGLPVDFIAKAIATLGAAIELGHQSYHVANVHDDGVSLDTFVDWAAAAGCPIQRVSSYPGWYARFGAALRALPEAQRQRSSLPLLHQLAEPMPLEAARPLPAPRFEAAVRHHRIGEGGEIPPLTQDFIGKYLADLRHLGWLSN